VDYKSIKKVSIAITLIIFALSSIFTLFNLLLINTSMASENNAEWQITLNFNEPEGTSDTVVLGEKPSALDGQDQFDVPKPPTPQAPYLRSWFTSSLDPPYNLLWEDYRTSSDDEKVWDLTVLWVSNGSLQTNITITWDTSELEATNLDSVKLIIKDTIDMMDNNNYQFAANNNEPYTFQIVFKNEQSGEITDTNNSISTLLIIFVIIILIIIVIAFYVKRIKKK
jgi:hypothetical protein